MTEETKTTRKQPTKVQAVLTEPLRKQLTEFKNEKGYGNDGQALRAILSAFFNGETDISGYTTEHLENRIKSLEDALYHDDKNIPKRAEEAFDEYKSLADAYEDVAETQLEHISKIRDLERQVKELKNSMLSGSQAQNISKNISDISKDSEAVEAVSATNDKLTDPKTEIAFVPETDRAFENQIEGKIDSNSESEIHKSTNLIKEIARSKRWEGKENWNDTKKRREITRALIEAGLKPEGYNLSSGSFAYWKNNPEKPPKPKTKHYHAYLLWKTVF